jgi:hypothetical protein
LFLPSLSFTLQLPSVAARFSAFEAADNAGDHGDIPVDVGERVRGQRED